MRQFGKIFKFEFKNYLTNKIFVGVTAFLIILIAGVMFFPRITDTFDKDEGTSNIGNIANDGTNEIGNIADEETAGLPVMLVAADEKYIDLVNEAFSAVFTDYQVKPVAMDDNYIKEQITSENVQCAFVLSDLTSYTYYVNNLSMYDSNTGIASEILRDVYRVNAMVENGMSAEQAGNILNVQIDCETKNLGKDQMQNFFYTYIMIFALYFVLLLYGQMIATNVATEKSSRAMELLITSAKPVSMMFGKVLASCLAGFLQLAAVFGTAFVCYNANKSYWEDGGIMASIFGMPIELLIFMLVFFVLGFLIYAFLYGAVGSTASKLEDINTSSLPLTLLFIIGFFVVMFSMTSNAVDSTLMKVCSYIPFTSPMAMFTRIAMSTVPWYEIAISIAVLVASVIGVGVVSAKIYRVGVLLYGTPPKLSAIIKVIRKS